MRLHAWAFAGRVLKHHTDSFGTTLLGYFAPVVIISMAFLIGLLMRISATGNLGIALDTMTGRWCRTWEWEYKNKPGEFGLNTLPTCYELFLSEPSELSPAPAK